MRCALVDELDRLNAEHEQIIREQKAIEREGDSMSTNAYNARVRAYNAMINRHIAWEADLMRRGKECHERYASQCAAGSSWQVQEQNENAKVKVRAGDDYTEYMVVDHGNGSKHNHGKIDGYGNDTEWHGYDRK